METINEIKKVEPVSPLAAAADLCKANGDMDVAKLEKLLAMQERWDATQAKRAFMAAMAEFKKKPPEILKDKTVSYNQVSYTHSSLHNVTICVNKALSEHGLTASWLTDQENGNVKVTCVISHIQGHSERTSLSAPPDNSGKKNAIQQIASTVTYLQRYTLLALTGLATHDQDNDGKDAGEPKDILPPKPNEKQSKVLDAICKLLSDKRPDKAKVAAMFYEGRAGYPGDGAKVAQAAQWLVGLNRPLEWTKPATEDDDPFKHHCNACHIDFGPEDESDDCSQCKKCLSKDVVKQSERKKTDG